MSQSRVTHQLMRICAARLDEKITADEFIELLETLVDWCVEAGGNKATEEAATAVASEAGGPESQGAGESSPPKPGDPGYKPAHQHRRPRGGGGGGKKISDDTREQIRLDADLARDDEGKLPRGFVRGLATEHGVSDQTIYNILGD